MSLIVRAGDDVVVFVPNGLLGNSRFVVDSGEAEGDGWGGAVCNGTVKMKERQKIEMQCQSSLHRERKRQESRGPQALSDLALFCLKTIA